MGYRIKSVSMDGFMNIVSWQSLNFGRGVKTITGANGTGKSNLLSSVTWKLTGLMPFPYEGYEVANGERDEAKVTLEMTGPTETH